MKSRRTSLHDPVHVTRPKSQSVLLNKASSSAFLKKKFPALDQYACLFGQKVNVPIGDADTIFRKSLRRYNDFDIAKNTAWIRQRGLQVRPSRSHQRFLHIEEQQASGDSSKERREESSPELAYLFNRSQINTRSDSLDSSMADSESESTPASVEHAEEAEEGGEVADSPAAEVEAPLTAEAEGEEPKADEGEQQLEAAAPEAAPAPEDQPAEDAALDETSEEQSVTVVESTKQTEKTELDQSIAEMQKAVGALDTIGADVQSEMNEHLSAFQVGDTIRTGEVSPAETSVVQAMDNKVLVELEQAEVEARRTASIITTLKERVMGLLQREHMTEGEAKELESMNQDLLVHMETFETRTRMIQKLVNFADQHLKVPGKAVMPAKQEKRPEDMLPKVIICGTTENNMPKIIICDAVKTKKKLSDASRVHAVERASFSGQPAEDLPKQRDVVPQFAKRLSESYDMQEKLAADNVDLEGKRIQLQEELLRKDRTCENLQQCVGSLQAEMRILAKQNAALNEQLVNAPAIQGKCRPRPDMPCGGGKGLCPADVENRLQQYTQTNSALRKQIETLEGEMKKMHDELIHVQRAHQDMEQQCKQAMQPAQPAAPQHLCRPTCQGPCRPGAAADQQLRELREQYNRLQDDYKAKVTEVAGLRADNEKLKSTTQELECAKRCADCRVEEMEQDRRRYDQDMNKWKGSKEQIIEQEQQLTVAKQRFREAQDELEEVRALIGDQTSQLEDYRNKYLQAQQQVEEQRRHIDMMELENNRVSEQVAVEIQRIKNQFQEKIIELSPLPDILKGTQMKLQEEQQMRLMAERNGEALARELQLCKDKAQEMLNQMEKVRSDQVLNDDERASMQNRINGWECKCNEVQQNCEKLKTTLARAEESAAQSEKRLDEKLHEVAQLTAQLETVREESARQVARIKDRCETVRRSMQSQIADLERQLAQARALARGAQKDRDEIRQKMQAQMNDLVANFDEAQMRIRSLQGHVNFLQTSYTNIYREGVAGSMGSSGGKSGADAAMIADENCDCGGGSSNYP